MIQRPLPGAAVEVLDVILTAGCNLRCAYCYQNEKKSRRMSWDTLRGALDLLLGSPGDEGSILFLGGEPLLEFDLIRQAVAYVRASKRRRKRVGYSIITNGMLVRDEHAAFLARHRFDTQLSFDGIPAAQDVRGRGTFGVLDALVDRLRVRQPAFFKKRLTISLTITAATMPHLAESVAYFLDKGVAALAVSPVITHDPGWTLESKAVLEEQFERVFRMSLRHYRRTGDVPFLGFRKQRSDDVHAPQGDALCGAPSGRTLAVDVDGQVHGCAVFTESYQTFTSPFLKERVEAMRLGDFRTPGFDGRLALYPEAARATGLFHARHEKYSSYGRCAECRFVAECAICPASIGHIPGNTDPRRVPDFGCAYNLVSLACRERFPDQPTALDVLTGRVRAYGPLREVQRKLAPAVPRRAVPATRARTGS